MINDTSIYRPAVCVLLWLDFNVSFSILSCSSRNPPPMRTENRLIVENLSSRVSWQVSVPFLPLCPYTPVTHNLPLKTPLLKLHNLQPSAWVHLQIIAFPCSLNHNNYIFVGLLIVIMGWELIIKNKLLFRPNMFYQNHNVTFSALLALHFKIMQLIIEGKGNNNNEINFVPVFNFNQFFTPLFASLTVVSYGRARYWWS